MSNSQPFPSFEELYREHRDTVRRGVSRYVDPEDVEDVSQEVFAKIAQQLGAFERRSSLRTWIHRVAVNTALDRVRSRSHRNTKKTVSLDSPQCSSGECPCERSDDTRQPPAAPERLIQSEMCRCIREQVDSLSAEYREILRLKDEEHLTAREIAERLILSVDAAKIRLHRARKALRAQLDRSCDYYRTQENVLSCDRKSLTKKKPA